MKVFVYCIYALLIISTISNVFAYRDQSFFKTLYSKIINIVTPASAITYLIIVLVRHQRLVRKIKNQPKIRNYENN